MTHLVVLTDPQVAAQVAVCRGLAVLAAAHLAGTAAVDRWQTRRRYRPLLWRHAARGS